MVCQCWFCPAMSKTCCAMRDAAVAAPGLLWSPILRQEIIDAVLTAKTRAPYAVLLCQKGSATARRVAAGCHAAGVTRVGLFELPPQLPLLVISRVGPAQAGYATDASASAKI